VAETPHNQSHLLQWLAPQMAKKRDPLAVVETPLAPGAKQAPPLTAKQQPNGGASQPPAAATPRIKVMQTDMPSLSLDQALRVSLGIWNDFAGKSAAPHDIAFAVGMTPTSGPWRTLTGASIAYGLTEGGYAADVIKLTPLGRRIVAPEAEGDDLRARAEAVLKPRIMREFFHKYDRAKFPQDAIAANVLVSMGLPKERAAEAVQALKASGKDTGLIRETKTGLFVALPQGGAIPVVSRADAENDDTGAESDVSAYVDTEVALAASAVMPPTIVAAGREVVNDKVFITHGKTRAVVTQIKELLLFGKFEPVVSVERESTAVPVPDKVFHDMRECAAGVIHVNSEGELLDPDGNKVIHLNHNVLIEIGAAIALYGKRVILLVQKGVVLPSNLQGLYRCEYEGDKLDYDATMKLLKTFNEFRSQG
jgi:predicted nucleotide-binding protein